MKRNKNIAQIILTGYFNVELYECPTPAIAPVKNLMLIQRTNDYRLLHEGKQI